MNTNDVPKDTIIKGTSAPIVKIQAHIRLHIHVRNVMHGQVNTMVANARIVEIGCEDRLKTYFLGGLIMHMKQLLSRCVIIVDTVFVGVFRLWLVLFYIFKTIKNK